MTDISICVVSHNNTDGVCELLSSIRRFTGGLTYRIYVVDNGEPVYNTAKALSGNPDFSDVTVIKSENRGFGAGHNTVLPMLDSEFHVIVNPDVTLDTNVLPELIDYMRQHPDCVLAVPRVLNSDMSEQYLPRRRPTLKYLVLGRLSDRFHSLSKYRDEYTMKGGYESGPCPVDFCSGCFTVARTDALKTVGGFDERYFMYLEDADLTDRMQGLGKTVLVPASHVIHNWEGGSRTNRRLFYIHIRSMLRYLRRKKRVLRAVRRGIVRDI